MKPTIVTLTFLIAVQLACAQEQVPRKDALKAAFYVSVDLKMLQGTPIATDVDLKQPFALRDGDYGALVLPEAKLSADAIAKANDKTVPIGQLWLRKLTPMRNGEAISGSQLRLVNIQTEQESGTAVQCALGVKGNASGGLELLVFGSDKTPLVTVPLKKIEGSQDAPITMTAMRGEESGRITLRILGRYEATLTVTQLPE